MWDGKRLLSTSFTLALIGLGSCQPAQLPWSNCSSPKTVPNSPNQLQISSVYAQFNTRGTQRYFNLTLFGSAPQVVDGISSDSHLLATMFTTTSVLTSVVSSSASAFCDSLRPPSPLPALNSSSGTANYCPLQPGDFAFATSSQVNHQYELLSLNTRVRIVDASQQALELACIDVFATPLKPSVLNSKYGHAVIVFWSSVALAILYWVIVGLARIAAAWKRGAGIGPHSFWSRFQRAGFVLASAISGEKLSSQPALLRFNPFFAQTAWSVLIYNITLTQGRNASLEHWDPIHVPVFDPPSGFSDQVSDMNGPIFVDPSVPNTLFTLPQGTRDGMESFAYAVGIRPQDLFGTCVGLFLIIVGGVIAVSLLIWATDWFFSRFNGISRGERRRGKGTRSPRWSVAAKDALGDENHGNVSGGEEDVLSGPATPRAPSHLITGGRWRNIRIGDNSFHRDILWGNIIRVLVLFHLPITIFSAFQFSHPHPEGTILSMVLAVLAFVAFCVLLPAILISRLITTRTNKLYDDTHTLLSLGPLYNQYASGSKTFAKLLFINNLAFGIIVGCGQRSGSAQAIVVLIIEVASALWTSVYLPWGRGAAMGAVSFLLCVGRIISAVLLVILSPVVSVGSSAGGWVACAILLIQLLVYGFFLLMLLVKVVEGVLRIALRKPFDQSRHTMDTGILGVLFSSRGSRGSRQQRYQIAQTRTKGSLSSQDMIGRPSTLKNGSYLESSRGPPSVLRADQVRMPYREDADDESGHILGAWPPMYNDTGDTSPPPNKTGFSRVRGGRANFDTPYAIMPSHNAQPFPRSANPPREPLVALSDLPPVSTSSGLPPGAMAPVPVASTSQMHTRKKSQTAIVENVTTLQSPYPIHPSNISPVHPTPAVPRIEPSPQDDDDDDDDDVLTRKRGKRHWFSRRPTNTDMEDESRSGRWGFLSGRRRSEGDERAVDDEDGDPIEASAGRSFVVIRDKRPSVPLPVGFMDEEVGPSSWRDPLSRDPPERPPRSPKRSAHSARSLQL